MRFTNDGWGNRKDNEEDRMVDITKYVINLELSMVRER